MKIYLKKKPRRDNCGKRTKMFAWWWRDAGTLAERQREGPLSQQRGRRRDDTAAGGWRQRRNSRRERETAAAGVDFSPEVAERERDVLAWFLDGVAVVEERNGGGAARDGGRPEMQREMERNCRESCAREEERGCCF